MYQQKLHFDASVGTVTDMLSQSVSTKRSTYRYYNLRNIFLQKHHFDKDLGGLYVVSDFSVN